MITIQVHLQYFYISRQMYSYKKIYIQGHQILSRLRLQKDKTIYIGRNQNNKIFVSPQR